MNGAQWRETRWWRVLYADGRVYPPEHYLEGQRQLWWQTSNEEEAYAAQDSCPGGGVLEKLWERTESRWEPVE